MEIVKRAIDTFSIVILAVCCGVFLLFGISGTGWKALAIPTGSMRPDMPPGSIAFVRSVPAASLKVGDIVTYTDPLNPKITLSHRIIKEYMLDGKVPTFVTKGDANKVADIPITIGSIKGKVMWHVQDIGNLLIDVKKPIIILPVVYLAGIFVMIEETRRLNKYFKGMQPYRWIGYDPEDLRKPHNKLVRYAEIVAIIAVVASIAIVQPVHAQLRSNTVALNNNTLMIAPANKCKGDTTNVNNVSVTNINNQNTQSGNATSNNGTATSGNATSSSSSSNTVTINEGC